MLPENAGEADRMQPRRTGRAQVFPAGPDTRGEAFFPEPAVRLRPLALVLLLVTPPALAISFQTRLENVEWTVEGDRFECRLAQPVSRFGSGEFVRRAGEQATFRLRSRERWMGPGAATLLAAAAP